jgi:hypothetical protein
MVAAHALKNSRVSSRISAAFVAQDHRWTVRCLGQSKPRRPATYGRGITGWRAIPMAGASHNRRHADLTLQATWNFGCCADEPLVSWCWWFGHTCRRGRVNRSWPGLTARPVRLFGTRHRRRSATRCASEVSSRRHIPERVGTQQIRDGQLTQECRLPPNPA